MEVERRSKFLYKQEVCYAYYEKIPQSYTACNYSIQKVTEERVKEAIVQETDFYKYLRMIINKLGNLKDHILELNRKCETSLCKPLCKKSEDTTEHVLECEKAKKFTLSKENIKGEWVELTEIYKENRKNREVAVIKLQISTRLALDQHQIIKESGKKNKIRKIKGKEKSRKISRKRRQKRLKGRKCRKEEQEDKNDNNIKKRNVQKDKEKSKGNITGDRQRIKVEENQERKQKTKKEIEA